MEKVNKITAQTLVPIGLLFTICGVVWLASRLDSRVTMNTGRVEAVEKMQKESPSRTEFNILVDDVKEIKQDTKTVIEQLMRHN